MGLTLVSEAKAGFGKAAESEPQTSGGLVSEQEGKVRDIYPEVGVFFHFVHKGVMVFPNDVCYINYNFIL